MFWSEKKSHFYRKKGCLCSHYFFVVVVFGGTSTEIIGLKIQQNLSIEGFIFRHIILDQKYVTKFTYISIILHIFNQVWQKPEIA